MSYPHLIETTMTGYSQRTYVINLGYTYADLSDEEKAMVASSKAYVKEYEAKENLRLLNLARSDFEKLRDIENMPEEAIRILKQWTSRDEDDEDYDYE